MASAGSKERARAEEASHPASAVLGVTVKPSRISHASAVLRRNELSVEDCARLLAARSVSPAAAARLLTTLCDASACATHEIETRVDAQNVCHDCGAWAVVLEGFYNCLDIGADSGLNPRKLTRWMRVCFELLDACECPTEESSSTSAVHHVENSLSQGLPLLTAVPRRQDIIIGAGDSPLAHDAVGEDEFEGLLTRLSISRSPSCDPQSAWLTQKAALRKLQALLKPLVITGPHDDLDTVFLNSEVLSLVKGLTQRGFLKHFCTYVNALSTSRVAHETSVTYTLEMRDPVIPQPLKDGKLIESLPASFLLAGSGDASSRPTKSCSDAQNVAAGGATTIAGAKPKSTAASATTTTSALKRKT